MEVQMSKESFEDFLRRLGIWEKRPKFRTLEVGYELRKAELHKQLRKEEDRLGRSEADQNKRLIAIFEGRDSGYLIKEEMATLTGYWLDINSPEKLKSLYSELDKQPGVKAKLETRAETKISLTDKSKTTSVGRGARKK